MKKFEFSLSHVLDYRERLLDEEKGALQRIKAERDEIAENIRRLEDSFAQVSLKMVKAQTAGTTILEIKKINAQLENIRMQLDQQRKELQRAELKVEHQMKAVIAANQEVSKLDKLQERQLEEYRHEVNKAEEDRVDEFVAQTLARSAG